MDLHPDDPAFDPETQQRHDRRRLFRALNLSLAFVLLLAMVYSAQGSFDVRPFTIAPLSADGLLGILTAPLLHGSLEHIAANASALLILGTLAGAVYPRATLWAIPLVWLGAGLGPWLLADPGTHTLGASGLTHGLMFMVFMLGLLRRDRAAIAAGMIAFLFYGGMVLTVLPREATTSSNCRRHAKSPCCGCARSIRKRSRAGWCCVSRRGSRRRPDRSCLSDGSRDSCGFTDNPKERQTVRSAFVFTAISFLGRDSRRSYSGTVRTWR